MLLLLALLLSSAFLHLVPALDDEGTEPPPQQLTLQRDSVLEAPLLELLLAPLWTESGDASTPLDIRLQSAFSQCRELGVTSFLYETSVDTSGGALPALDPLDVAYCHRLRYVRHQREHARSVRKELAAKHSVPENLPSVERRPAADVSFQEFFELYAEKSRPLILELHEDDKDPVAQLLGLTASSDDGGGIESTLDNFIGVCFGDNKSSKHQNENRGMSMRPMRVEDGSCAALLESTFRVPIYMTHDYLQRTNASRDEAFVPSIIDLPAAASDQDDGPASADDIVSCPYGLHMLVIPLGDSVGTHISLFNRKFKPIKMPVRMQEHREVALAADANVAAGSRGNTVLDAAIFEQAPEQYSSIELKPGKDMLFAPGGIIPSMRSAIPSSAGAKVLRFCYCDAANIKDVKQAAGLDALLMTEDNKDLGVYALLHAFQSPGFDTSFTRRPALSDCSWHNFVQWPREPAYLSKKNRRSRGGGANNDDVEGEDEQMSRRERLKQWQDDKRLRVAAMNVLGAGLWSHRSSSIKIPRQSRRRLSSTGSGGSHQGVAVPILKGVGDPGYTVVSGVDILSQNDLSTLVAQDPQHIFRTSGAQIKDVMLPRVLLSDVEEQVRVLSNNNSEESMGVVRSFEAWASHHSPRIFDVSAELVLADPPDASGPLRNAHAVRDRVVLALRGGVPFVFKLHYAQRAGALGLIIADANGSCSGSFDQSCVPGADKGRREGFAAQERHRLWDQARIPCVLVLQDAAKDLLERLNR
ncbi:hypothetical protein PHYBOEH_003960 [Phytophthora boehmeriae]|uniref:PA domain-containing protein n=1 Tax=Phytophthora boehmeriae TaxID=109152 RepID=A0A8T1WTT5_9STRA|nr:hypothetical protein PHYBOEH_003960 [Phytophthora boehmeriae]